MGQYYTPVILEEKKLKVDKIIDLRNYGVGLKLMEHAYMDNIGVKTAMYNIRTGHARRIGWVGDYSLEKAFLKRINENVFDEKSYKQIVRIAWGEGETEEKREEAKRRVEELPLESGIDFRKGYLVNLSKGLYIDIEKYCKQYIEVAYFPSPLALLTTTSNGGGGGDYEGINCGECGCWAFDVIEWRETQPPVGEFEEFAIKF